MRGARLLGRSPRRAPARPGLRRPRAPYPVGAARDCCGARAPSAPSGPGPRGVPIRSPASLRPAPAPWILAPVPRPSGARTARRCSGRYCRRGRVSSYLQSAANGSEAGPGRGGVPVRPRPRPAPSPALLVLPAACGLLASRPPTCYLLPLLSHFLQGSCPLAGLSPPSRARLSPLPEHTSTSSPFFLLFCSVTAHSVKAETLGPGSG